MSRTAFRLSDACRALGVALGALTLWTFLVGWLTERQPDHEDGLQVAVDGTIYVLRYTNRGDHVDVAYHKLVGAGLEPAKPPARLGSWSAGLAPTRMPLHVPISFFEMNLVARLVEPGTADVWHFVVDRAPSLGSLGRAYFVLFDSRTRRPVRFIAREGGLSQRPAADQMFVLGDIWFKGSHGKVGAAGYNIDWNCGDIGSVNMPFEKPEHSPPWRLTIVSGDQLVEVDLKAGTVRPLPGMNDLVDLTWISELLPEGRNEHATSINVVYGRTRESLVRLDPETFAARTFRLPETLKDSWIGPQPVSADQWALVIVEGKYSLGRHDVARLSADGTLSDRVDGVVTAPARSVYPPRTESLRIAAMTPSLVFALSLDGLRKTTIFGFPTNAATTVVEMAVMLTALFGAVAVVLGELWTRRHRHTAHPLWWAFLFLFGMPGLVGYVVHRKWPARAEAIAPAPNGLEIFA